MGRKRKKDKKKLAQKERLPRKPWLDISQETKNSILGISSFIVAIVAVLSFVGKAGSAGQYFDTLARSLFGWGFFIIPVALFLLSAAFVKSISRRIALSAFLGTLLFILAFLGLFFIIGNSEFEQGLEQGGYLGVVFGYPLLRFVGFWASLIVLVAAMTISILLALDVPIYRIITKKEEEGVIINNGNQAKPAKNVSEKSTRPATSQKPVATGLTDKEFVLKNLRPGKWTLPPLDLLAEDQEQAVTADINASAAIIKRTLANFGVDVEMGEVSVGPTVTQFTMRPAVGVKLSRITALNSDLALALAAHPIRIEAPIPGKSLVGIEVPNRKVAQIGLHNMFDHADYRKSKFFLPIALGRDVSGVPVFAGLEKMPHILIAGATGTGKSVAINSILLSFLYKHSPEALKLILIDPKRVELSLYNGIPHLITPVITDNKKVLGALRWAVSEMDRRYDVLLKSGAKDIFSYNAKMTDRKEPIMPVIVIAIDELADLMASYGRDVEAVIVRLAQMSRAVGIHLILSTQRPSVEVITGLIKANITSRIALQVASQIDSRTILDMASAEKLLGKGDMLFLAGDVSKPRRLQGAMVSENEVKDVIKFITDQAKAIDLEEGDLQVDFNATGKFAEHPVTGLGGGDSDVDDDMYEDAKALVIDTGKASSSFLQRRLKLGYARAARLLDIMEDKGIVGPGEGAKPRDVYIKPDGKHVSDDIMAVNADTDEAEQTEES